MGECANLGSKVFCAQLGTMGAVSTVVLELLRTRHDSNSKCLAELCGCLGIVDVFPDEELLVKFYHRFSDSDRDHQGTACPIRPF